MITGIAHVAFRVTDLDPALDFYCTKLGFREAFRLEREGEPSPWIVYVQVAAGCFLELFPGAREAGPRPGAAAGYNHFSLRVDDIEATLRALADRGLPITDAPTMGLDGNWQYWITDPDGNRIELMQIMPNSPQAAAETGWQPA
jgi:catechol 2,3-dioxygenase-like lactoylglutathione lyase family enzyme